MSDEKPNYAEIIKSRKPVPTLDLNELRRRSAQATEATTVLQAPQAPSEGPSENDIGPTPTPAARDERARIELDATDCAAVSAERVPLRFSVSKEEHHRLRIQAAVENRSVPQLMRAIIADYLLAHGRAP